MVQCEWSRWMAAGLMGTRWEEQWEGGGEWQMQSMQ